MEEMGIAEIQFRLVVRNVIDQLKELKELGVSDKAAQRIEELVDMYQKTIEE